MIITPMPQIEYGLKIQRLSILQSTPRNGGMIIVIEI